MDHYQKKCSNSVFDYIIDKKLPLSLCKSNGYIIVNCHSWDIQEIDELLQSFNGQRIGFDVKISLMDIYEKPKKST